MSPNKKKTAFDNMEGIIPTEEWNNIYWDFNLPLQMWPLPNGNWRVVNYMPRHQRCEEMEQEVTEAELPQFCKNAATVLRNLANLFDTLAEKKINVIYYPDQDVDDAIKEYANEIL